MSKTIFYSFRTNKLLPKFRENNVSVFVFGHLKKDFERFSNLIARDQPEVVLGFANVRGNSRSEVRAVNRFGRGGKISASGRTSYVLKIFGSRHFPVAKSPSTSFCNWTMYKTAEWIQKNRLITDVGFIHFNESQGDDLIDLCVKLSGSRHVDQAESPRR